MRDSDAWLAKLMAEDELLGESEKRGWPGGDASLRGCAECGRESRLSCHVLPHAPSFLPPPGVRIMEVRAAYAQSDFEWDNLKRLAIEGIEEGNTRLLRQHASQRFGTLLTGQSGRGSSEAAGGGGGEDAAPGS